ncbi:alpha/beta hydrolase [Pseudorhodoplanes sinuspersici]|uniref:Alpha/beta hydrolase n=2 Tax=Pseudorhodoplanes sinuspersici TaxID=1235591 RepID=A0A1W7A174_9HYPH|nr:alpha/beta hydrolase [Pseudorhodoplanes sinuspersici]
MKSLPIVLIPGLACTARLYTGQMPALGTFGPITVADHRRADHVDTIARQILDNAPRRFALAGLSMGGYIALAIMRIAPERVAKLALLDTGSRSDTPEQTERRKAQIAMAQNGQLEAINDILWPLLVHAERKDDAALKAVVTEMSLMSGAEAFVRQQQAIMTRPDSRPFLPAITCPTLVLVGDGDQLTPPHLAEEMASLIPGSRHVVVRNCGHLSTLEQPEFVTKTLMEWMKI